MLKPILYLLFVCFLFGNKFVAEGKIYVAGTNSFSWNDSMAACSKIVNGQLVTISDENDYSDILNYMLKIGVSNTWTAGKYDQATKTWRYATNDQQVLDPWSYTPFLNWAGGSPTNDLNHRLSVDTLNIWTSSPDGTWLPYICETDF